MLHYYFKWRYERKARSGAFELPKEGRSRSPKNENLGSFLSSRSGPSRSFKPFDLARKRRKIMQLVTTAILAAFVVWVTYESLIALAIIGK